MTTTICYIKNELPQSIQPFVQSELICQQELDTVIDIHAISMHCIDKMKQHNTPITPIEAFRFGISKGFDSLEGICAEFARSPKAPSFRSLVVEMAIALQPFYPNIIDLSQNPEKFTQQLLRAKEEAKAATYKLFDNIEPEDAESVLATANQYHD